MDLNFAAYTPNPESLTPEQQELYNTLRPLFRPSVTPCTEALNALGIRGEFEAIFLGSGLDCIYFNRDAGQFREATCEFIASFETETDESGATTAWNFCLGGRRYHFTRAEVCTIFGFNPDAPRIRDYHVNIKDEVWRAIAGMDLFVPGIAPNNMTGGVWRYVHRIINLTLNHKRDGGRIVNNTDMNIMTALYRRDPVDWFGVLTDRFSRYWAMKADAKCTGGGIFVTIILNHLGLNMSQCEAVTKKFTLASMVQSSILSSDRVTWFINPHPPPKAHKSLTIRRSRESALATLNAERSAEASSSRQRRQTPPPRSPPANPAPAPAYNNPNLHDNFADRFAEMEFNQRTFFEEVRGFHTDTRNFISSMNNFSSNAQQSLNSLASFNDYQHQHNTWVGESLNTLAGAQNINLSPQPVRMDWGNFNPSAPLQTPNREELDELFNLMHDD